MNGIVKFTLKSSQNPIKLTRFVSLLSGNYRQNEKPTGNFVPVYKFPFIVPFSLINRLKVYQTALTAVSLPGAIILNQLEHISREAVIYTGCLGLSGCLALYSLGYLTQNMIGILYYNEESDTVKVSYSDFWGRRKDILIPRNDVIPIDELPVTPLDGLYLTFRRFSTKKTLKLNLRFGIILDKETMKQIL